MTYRDKKTGKLVSKEKWKRSRARGGTRYVRVRRKSADVKAAEAAVRSVEREVKSVKKEVREAEAAVKAAEAAVKAAEAKLAKARFRRTKIRARRDLLEAKATRARARAAATRAGTQLKAAEARSRPPRAKKPPSGGRIEYVLHFDYGSRKAHNLIRFQVHLIGPRVPDREAIEVARQWERTGHVPSGWTQRAIYWGHPRGTEDVGEKPTARTANIEATVLNVGRAKVRRKNPAS